MKITPKALKKELISVLKNNDIPYTSVSVKQDETIDMILGVNWYEDGSIVLQYREMLKDFTEKEINAVLKHEICHYLSLPTSKMTVYTGAESYGMKYNLVFREYLAHKEFKERFGVSEDLRSYHIKLFGMHDVIVMGARDIIRRGMWDRFTVVVDGIFGMLYTAMYFYVFEDNAFRDWCYKKELSNLHTLFSWVYDDMKYFAEMTAKIEDRDFWIQKAGAIFVSMDFSRLLMNNALTFHSQILNRRHEIGEIADFWERRFHKYNVELI